MKRYRVEIKLDIEEHVPICVQAEGNDMDELRANAEYSVDCPDPKVFHPIDELSERSYNRVVQEFRAEMSGQDEMRAEAQADRLRSYEEAGA